MNRNSIQRGPYWHKISERETKNLKVIVKLIWIKIVNWKKKNQSFIVKSVNSYNISDFHVSCECIFITSEIILIQR